MPRGDGTGPTGMGPMTGRAAGICAGNPVPGFANPAPGAGFWGGGRGGRFGRGGGRGWRHQFYATGLTGRQRAAMGTGIPGAYPAPYAAQPFPAMTREQEIEALKAQAEHVENSLAGIKDRIGELEGGSEG